ncbi:MAG: hypothetical protein HKL92_06535 [Candidatus Eremiobacteraeota bacterium]|nr:hypothetical protein [Candidatus Eremiobacteraeota bacterium]NNM92984.1 hypothetical protein [Candidatus Eremiobacteraeota bacterium]
MAIRPVDLQVAYLAAPQNAAIVANIELAPQAAQQAAELAFAQQATKREESIAEAANSEHGSAVRERTQGESQGFYQAPGRRQGGGTEDDSSDGGGEQHFIDTMA